ncbi:hypothetical protein OEZ86_001321 [Tetradesmus obliquus]|nr:hypothetical protein OEZ86_001321 [Tetradesmus obliquus]
MDAADKSDARLLLKLQQALQGSAGAAAAAPPLQFVPGVFCGQQAAAEALAEALKNPRRYNSGSIAASELRRGSSRPRKTGASSAATDASSSSRLLHAAPEVTSASRLWKLTVRCGASCDLMDILQHAAPVELALVTLPSLVDVLPTLGWPLQVAAASPGPAKLRVNFPAEQCSSLGSLYINTAHTRAGMVIDDKLLISISSSCPNLRCLKLKGVLGFSSSGGEAMRTGLSKLQVLSLRDTRRQALQQLARLAVAADSAIEPDEDQAHRLEELHESRMALIWKQ